MSRWTAILFDLDDTLYPERDYVMSGFGAVAAWVERELGITAAQTRAEMHALFYAGVRGSTFDDWLRVRGLHSPERVAAMVDAYRGHVPTLQPFAGVPELLRRLRPRYRLALVTDGHSAVQRHKLDALKLAPYFDAVVVSDELGRAHWKPSPLPFLTALRHLGVRAEESVCVGDNPRKDFLAARRAGLASIWVRREGGEYCGLEPETGDHTPTLTIPSLEELEPALERLEDALEHAW